MMMTMNYRKKRKRILSKVNTMSIIRKKLKKWDTGGNLPKVWVARSGGHGGGSGGLRLEGQKEPWMKVAL